MTALINSLLKNARTSLVSKIAFIVSLVGTGFLEFATKDPGAVKGPVGAAAVALVGLVISQEHATARNTDNASVAAAVSKGASAGTAAAGGVEDALAAAHAIVASMTAKPEADAKTVS